MTKFRDIPLLSGEVQVAFGFYDATIVPRQATLEDVKALVAFLRGRGWMRALRIIRAKPLGLNFPASVEDAKRKLRAIAEAGPDQLLAFPGSKGYRLLVEAELTELRHGARSHRSQSRKHLVRFRHILVEMKRRDSAAKAATRAVPVATQD